MRKQIAAANWKMNLTKEKAQQLLTEVLKNKRVLQPNHEIVFGVPFPYLALAKDLVGNTAQVKIAAQNCSDKVSGAYTGEVSAEMLQSLHIDYVILGHSERREYYNETDALLAQKINRALEYNLQIIFCCGETLPIREAGNENAHVQNQISAGLFHLNSEQLKNIVIAYEPVWAIGTGKTATAQQAQDMQQHIRKVIENNYGAEAANAISILYGGSVKASNAKEIFGMADVDGGLVGGASLMADEFIKIIEGLK